MAKQLSAMQAELAALPPNAEVRLLAIFDYIKGPIDDAIHAVGGVDQFITQVNALYDQYIAPVDIPWVPNIVEVTVIDPAAKMLIASIIRRLHDSVHKMP